MLEQLTAFTELEAVNEIIATIGESPINSLEELNNVDAINALSVLRSISRQEQARGWSFNMTPHLVLHPDNETHKIRWNDTFIYIKSKEGRKLVKYGEYVKDLLTNEVVFKKPLEVEVVIHVPFEDLPEAMKRYIEAKACCVFQSRYLGDESMNKITQMEVQLAWQYLQEYEIDNNNYSMLQHSSVQSILER